MKNRWKAVLIVVAVLLTAGLSSAGWSIIQPAADGTSDLDAKFWDSNRLDQIVWGDVAMAESDVNVSHLGPADANLDMNNFDITNCAFINNVQCDEIGGGLSGNENLSLTLTLGNSAGTNDIDMDGFNITNVGNWLLQFVEGPVNTSHLETGAVTSWKHDKTNGSVIWTQSAASGDMRDVRVDPQGFVYAGGNGNTVYKYDPDGNEVWSNGIGSTMYGLGVGPDGYVYAGDSNDDLHKIDPNGNDVWTQAIHTGDINEVVVGPNGDIHTVGDDGYVKQVDPSGTVNWDFNTSGTAEVFGLDVGWNGNVYVGTTDGTSSQVLAFDKDGSSLWNFTTPTDYVDGVAVDGPYVYAGGGESTVWKLWGANGSEVNEAGWPYSYDDNIAEIDVDGDGRVYIVDYQSSDHKVHVVDSDGNFIWEDNDLHVDDLMDVAVDARGYIYTASDDDTTAGTVKKTHGGGYATLSGHDGTTLFSLGQ